MQFELVSSPALYDYRDICTHHITVAVDVLRATTSICAAFKAGTDEVVPLDSLDPLPDFFERGYTIAAERDGKKIDNAMCGNSPTEYMRMNLKGKRLAYSTTNGTVSILRAKESELLLVGAFANLSQVAHFLRGDGRPVVVLCSGWKNVPCIEDTLFAGALAQQLMLDGVELELINDPAMMALDLWDSAKKDLYGYCAKATHFHRLQRLSYDCDIRFALRLDTCPVLPAYDKQSFSLRLL